MADLGACPGGCRQDDDGEWLCGSAGGVLLTWVWEHDEDPAPWQAQPRDHGLRQLASWPTCGDCADCQECMTRELEGIRNG